MVTYYIIRHEIRHAKNLTELKEQLDVGGPAIYEKLEIKMMG